MIKTEKGGRKKEKFTFLMEESLKNSANFSKISLPPPSRTSTQIQDFPPPKSASGPQ